MSADSIFFPPLPETTSQVIFWDGLTGCADSLAIASAIKNENRLLVVITPDNQTALRLEHEIALFLGTNDPILHFPNWETLPYDVFSPLPEIISERLKTLARLPETQSGALVVSVSTLMHRLAPREHVLAHSFSIKKGDRLNLELTRVKLESVGYQCVSQVYQHAEFAVRGSIIDLFPMGSQSPYRIELWDEEIESIRIFDPETQLSEEKINQIQLFPAREFPFTDEAIKRFRQAFRHQFSEASSQSILYQDVSQGIASSGIEYYFPLFVETTATLFDYLPTDTVLFIPPSVDELAEAFYYEVEERFQQRQYDVNRPLLNPEQLFLSASELKQKLSLFRQVILNKSNSDVTSISSGQSLIPFKTGIPPDLTIDNHLKKPAERLLTFIENFTGRLLFIAETAGHREDLIDHLRQYQITLKQVVSWQDFLAENSQCCVLVAQVDRALLLNKPAIAIITESQLSGEKVQQQRRRRKSAAKVLENIFNNLNELTIGSPVVHQDYGVGRYLGLQVLEVGGIQSEFLTLAYANDDKLYVPVASLQLIGRYSGASEDTAPLHKLGNDRWTKAKQKAMQRARDVAAELLDIHAKRAAGQGHAFVIENEDYLAFAADFPFEETPDQQAAIDSLYQDMLKPQPMDRVICGDVGFGKTEVAMRAAFIAVQNHQQVSVLVPTTLLAQQHYQNFRDRFADWPVRIEVMSRFVTAKQQKQIIKDLAAGIVDIVIGTHKLLSKEIIYQTLGLVIIDEEHRFGVRQKEYFKKMRHQVDMLTLTATPIPRTLNMAMSGLRDISIIASPPPNRHPIKTFISEWLDVQIQEACQREIKRGGQVFFLHNDVKTMDKMAREIERLVPEARVKIAHGQMAERELEKIMLDFYHQRFNLLLSTTIIESGIDIPSANTIIINRADKLGLAQLHQLRGRVGRSHHRAYAYCIVPPRSLMSKDAIKRLEAFERSGELGAGFMLSSHDMEIRGAGELLGDGQSGQIQEIGFSLYTELLERAVNALQSGKQPELAISLETGTEIDLQAPALIPEDYLPDIHARLVLYKRIANTETPEELRALKVEMIDRFGLVPEPVNTLFSITTLKQQATALGIKKIDVHSAGGRVVFTEQPQVNTEQLIKMIQTQPQHYQLDGVSILKFVQSLETTAEKINFVGELLTQLSPVK